MRQYDAIHRAAGSVSQLRLVHGADLLVSVEDVSRHNGVDTIAGWMALHGVAGGDKILFTTGRLTGEMVMKSAHNGIPILVSRNGCDGDGLHPSREAGNDHLRAAPRIAAFFATSARNVSTPSPSRTDARSFRAAGETYAFSFIWLGPVLHASFSGPSRAENQMNKTTSHVLLALLSATFWPTAQEPTILRRHRLHPHKHHCRASS